MVSETGSVKFVCEQIAVELPHFAGFAELNRYRRKLLELGMIGVDLNGVGFGNLSVRDGATSRFYITASGTAGISELTPAGSLGRFGTDSRRRRRRPRRSALGRISRRYRPRTG